MFLVQRIGVFFLLLSVLLAKGVELEQSLIPAGFQGGGHQAVVRVDRFVTPLSELRFVVGALDFQLPHLVDLLVSLFECLERLDSDVQLFKFHVLKDTAGDSLI